MASAASPSSSLSTLKNRGSSSSPSGVRLGSTFCPPLRLLGVAGDPVFSAHVGSRVQPLRASGKPVKGAVSMANKSVGDLSGADLKGKKVFVRADLNVPLDHSQNITDDTRIRAALPTIKYLIAKGAKVILSTHLGRPKGVTPKFSLSPLVPRLSELLGIEVVKADDCIGPEVENMVASLPDGGVLLLDQPEFARKLASLADLFVNDAFGTAHRAHASTKKLTSQNVAVIGGGAAGLAAAKELRQEGHTVVVFERQSELGGTWLYNPQTESDPIGSDPNREVVHSSLYQSLRTNLSREIMGFRDFPFVATGGARRDSRRFPCHEEVLRYLLDFAHKFKLNELVRFKTEVNQVKPENGKFKVKSISGGKEEDETFDAVIVCNGHFTEPNVAHIPGIEKWPGKQIHSHNYRVPQPYENLVVVIVGSSRSAEDISRELARVAKEVHVAFRSESTNAFQKQPGSDNMWLHPMITNANEDGSVIFDDGNMVFADIILYCTGYKYAFPFLDTIEAMTVDDGRVGPLYKHVFLPAFAPQLSFMGITSKVLPFPLYELQGKWIARVLSGRVSLPTEEEMMADVEAFYSRLDDDGVPKRYTHMLGLGKPNFVYLDWLAAQCGCTPMEEWRKQITFTSQRNRVTRFESYRDEWDDIENLLVLEAEKDFAKYLTDTEDDAHFCG